jgi:hypothetical protein
VWDRASVALVAAAVVLLGGCGGAARTINVVTTSSTATAKAGTCKVELTSTGGGVTSTAVGEIDFAHNLVDLSQSDTVNGKVTSVEEIFSPAAVYFRATGTAIPQNPSKPWIEFETGRSLSGAFSPVVGGDPTAVLKGLGATATDVHRLGTEQVRGVTTTHYSVKVTLAGQSAVFGVWIGRDGLLRRLQSTFVSDRSGTSVPVTTTTEFFDFGSPVSITVPPADQTSTAGPNQADFPQPSGAWHTSQHGHDDGVGWTVLVVPATRSGQCLAVKTSPTLAQTSNELAGNGEETSSPFSDHLYRHYQADCAPGPNSDDLDLLAPLLAGDTQNGHGSHFVAGLATSGVSDVVAHLSDGSAVTASIAAGTYVAWWSGARAFRQLTFNIPGGAGIACDNGGDTTDPLDGISCSDATFNNPGS